MLGIMTRTRPLAPLPAASTSGLIVLSSLALAACGGDSIARPGSAERVSLSFAAAGSATASSSAARSTVSEGGVESRLTVAGDEIVLTRVQLVLKEIELKLPVGMSTCGDSSSSSRSSSASSSDDRGRGGSDDDSSGDRSGDDCDEIEQGP